MGKYYIASPFFNEEQVEYCECLENLLTATDNSYYSPRQHGDTSDLDVPEYLNELKRKLIFKNNIEEIHNCDSIIVNLMHEDMGTLFEFGYACGLRLFSNINNYKKLDIITIPKLELNLDGSNNPLNSNMTTTSLIINITPSSNYQSIIDEIKNINHGFNNKIKILVDSTESGSNYFRAAFALGIAHAIGDTYYISPIKSRSNLMITESGIKQYLDMDDYKHNKYVIYKDSEIR